MSAYLLHRSFLVILRFLDVGGVGELERMKGGKNEIGGNFRRNIGK